MSIESMAIALHHSTAKGTTKVVLLGIANHDGDGGAWPTIATLARYANVDERSVQRAIRKLVQAGEVVVHDQDGGTRDVPDWQRPNRYTLTLVCPLTCDRTSNHRQRPASGYAPDSPLWINPVTPVSPGDASVTGGVTPMSPDPVTPVSPKPSSQPDPNHLGDVTTSRRPTMPACSECLQPHDVCIARARTSGHSYTPKLGRGRQAVASALDHFSDVREG